MATTIHTDPESLTKNSGGRTASWWARVASFPVVCMIAMAARLLTFSVQQITESDLWWHLRNAQNLLQYHSLSRFDTYSFTAAGKPWISFEWLSEVVYYIAFRALGLHGILLTVFAVFVLIYTSVYYRSWRAGGDCKDAAVTTFAAICMGGVSIGPRTLIFGWLCMECLLLVLDKFRRTGKGLWLLPPLFALWINFHGSWPFGMVVLAITIASGMVEGQWGAVTATRRSFAQLRALTLVMLVSAAALFINPFGYKLVFYPVDLFFHQQGVMNYIEEWHPVDFGTLNGMFAMVLIFGLLAAALFSRRKWTLEDVLLGSFALWTALSHVRFMFFAGLILMPILAPRLNLFPPYDREREKPWLNATIIAALIAFMVFFFPSNAKLQRQFDEEYPTAALNFMHQQGIQGRVFNQYKFGGYMEFHAPEIKTFIDGRADLFIHFGIFDDYLKAEGLSSSFEVLDKYGIQYVFMHPHEPMVYMLEHSAGWKTIYSDRVAILLERSPRP